MYKCFHCGAVCITRQEARKHFGTRPTATPLCQLTETEIKTIRDIEYWIGTIFEMAGKSYQFEYRHKHPDGDAL